MESSSSFGYVAALVSCVSFGSFAVPIKGEAANSVSVDPLGALHCACAMLMFLTCAPHHLLVPHIFSG